MTKTIDVPLTAPKTRDMTKTIDVPLTAPKTRDVPKTDVPLTAPQTRDPLTAALQTRDVTKIIGVPLTVPKTASGVTDPPLKRDDPLTNHHHHPPPGSTVTPVFPPDHSDHTAIETTDDLGTMTAGGLTEDSLARDADSCQPFPTLLTAMLTKKTAKTD